MTEFQNDMKNKFNSIVEKLKQIGVNVEWMMGDSNIQMKRDGSVKMKFSLRDDEAVCKENAKIVKQVVSKVVVSNKLKFSVSNQMETYRPEYKVIATVTE